MYWIISLFLILTVSVLHKFDSIHKIKHWAHRFSLYSFTAWDKVSPIYKKFIIIIEVQTCIIHKEFKCTEELQSFKHIYIPFLDYVKCQCICSTWSTFKISKKQFQYHFRFHSNGSNTQKRNKNASLTKQVITFFSTFYCNTVYLSRYIEPHYSVHRWEGISDVFIKGKNCPMKFKKEEMEGVNWGRL